MPELEKSMLHNKELPCATMETQHSKKKKKKKDESLWGGSFRSQHVTPHFFSLCLSHRTYSKE